MSGLYDPSQPYDQPSHDPQSGAQTRPAFRKRRSLMDELIPLPESTPGSKTNNLLIPINVLRRTGAVTIITVFLLSTIFLATSEREHRDTGLRKIFGVGSDAGVGGAEWVAQDLTDPEGQTDANQHIDFDRYIKMRTITNDQADLSDGKRLVFIGDIHGSFAPLQRLMTAINYNVDGDKIIHVGDLVAKGERNVDVLNWMQEFEATGVRGNHDQPVIQWRTWMEWAGGEDWWDWLDNIDAGGEGALMHVLGSQGKSFPKEWKWKGEHWKIAREMEKRHYEYLLSLPLTLHIPSLHTFVVHAGMLPYDPLKSLADPTQPLVAADKSNFADLTSGRLAEEISLLLGVKQNTDPYTLIEMRSVYTHGKKKGKVTKNSKKGKPWAKVWNGQMKRCMRLSDDEAMNDWDTRDDVDEAEDGDDFGGSDLQCSPVSIVYGHAAGRGLDIQKYTKGIDTGCVYGRQLTALILGDTTGIAGTTVHLSGHKGVLVSIDCGAGGV